MEAAPTPIGPGVAPTGACSRIHCDVTPATNKLESHVAVTCLERAVSLGLIADTSEAREQLRSFRFSRLASRVFPTADRARLEIALDFLYCFFTFDDLCDTAAAAASDAEVGLRALEERMVTIAAGDDARKDDEPVARALGLIMERVRKIAHASWVTRFAGHVKKYVEGVRWERAVRSGGETPELATFCKMRALSVGVMPSVDLVGMLMCNGDSADVEGCAYVGQLEIMVCNHIAWTNDVVSVWKDVRDGTADNVVLVIARERGVGWAEVVEDAVDMCNKEFIAFGRLERIVERLRGGQLDRDTKTYVQGLKHWIRGHLDWCSETARYREELESAA